MSNPRQGFDEKRNFIRMKIDIPARIEVHSASMDLQGVCRNLSGGGMQVEVDTPLEEGTEADIIIISEHGHSPMLKAKVKVARLIPGPDNLFTLGMEILSIEN